MLKTIDRFLIRELLLATLATLAVLLAVVLCSRLATYLGQVANGMLTKDVILQMLGLQSIRFLPVLMPVALLLGTMLTLGRLHQQSEMVALTACGYGPLEVYRPLYAIAVPLAALLAAVSLWVAPHAAALQAELQAHARQQAQLSVFSPGSFRETAGGQHVVYVESLDPSSGEMTRVFIQSREPNGVAITTGDRGHQAFDAEGTRYMVLDRGFRYAGNPGETDYTAISFERAAARLDAPPPEIALKREALPSAALLAAGSARDFAELHSRAGAPVSALLIALITPLLARARPREGRYGRLLAAILVYVIYVNLLGVGKAWMEKGSIGPLLGLWWVHAMLLAAAGGLWVRHFGWPVRRRVR